MGGRLRLPLDYRYIDKLDEGGEGGRVLPTNKVLSSHRIKLFLFVQIFSSIVTETQINMDIFSGPVEAEGEQGEHVG